MGVRRSGELAVPGRGHARGAGARRAARREVQRPVLHVRQQRALVSGARYPGPVRRGRELDGRLREAVCGREQRPSVGRRIRRRHLRRRGQHALPLLPRPIHRRHLRRRPRSPRPEPVRGRAEAPVRLRSVAHVGAVRRHERVPRRVVDRRALDAETQGHLLPAVQRLRHAVADVRHGHVHGEEPRGPVHLRRGEPHPAEDHWHRHRHGPRIHRRGTGRQSVAVLHDRHVEPAWRAPRGDGPRRVRRAGKPLRPGAERDASVGPRCRGRPGAARRFGVDPVDDQQDARDELEEHLLESASGSRRGLCRRQFHGHLVGAC